MKHLGKISSRLLIFGGPYSNLAATQAIYDKARDLKITADHIICTGDIVAYCGEPLQTVDLIREWGIHVVKGNCEESLATNQLDCGCGYEQGSACSTLSVAWYELANQRIGTASREWMEQLPHSITFSIRDYKFKVVHASVSSINQFIFASTPAQVKSDQIALSGADAVIGGHSGIPFGQAVGAGLWLNAGVIGMPANDGSSDGWYMLLDPDQNGFELSWHRLRYPAEISQSTTREAGMEAYANALIDGLWPTLDILPAIEREQQGKRLKPSSISIELDEWALWNPFKRSQGGPF
jgi:predicted phosphodiesterase